MNIRPHDTAMEMLMCHVYTSTIYINAFCLGKVSSHLDFTWHVLN